MNWIDQHKAGIITFLITGIITFALFSVHITLNAPPLAETFIDITPLSEEEEQKIQDFLSETKVSDKAYNEDQSYKEMMKTFKAVPADDFEQTMKEMTAEEESGSPASTDLSKPYKSSDYALNDEERKKYEALKKRLQTNEMAEHSKSASTFSYSLKDRKILYYDTPRYLCEAGGKVVVNIIVNADGSVKDCYINKVTNTSNECLLDTALQYAKQVLFNPSSTDEQIGSVTYYFRPKSN